MNISQENSDAKTIQNYADAQDALSKLVERAYLKDIELQKEILKDFPEAWSCHINSKYSYTYCFELFGVCFKEKEFRFKYYRDSITLEFPFECVTDYENWIQKRRIYYEKRRLEQMERAEKTKKRLKEEDMETLKKLLKKYSDLKLSDLIKE